MVKGKQLKGRESVELYSIRVQTLLVWYFFMMYFSRYFAQSAWIWVYMYVALYPDLPAHMQTLRVQLFQTVSKNRMVWMILWCNDDVTWTWFGQKSKPRPGLGQTTTKSWPNHDQVLAKPRPSAIIITSQNFPLFLKFWNNCARNVCVWAGRSGYEATCTMQGTQYVPLWFLPTKSSLHQYLSRQA